MNTPKRIRARVLTPEGLKQLRERVRSHEQEHNAGFKYTLERLGELTGLDPESVKHVLEGTRADKRTIVRCFETFGLTLEDRDHVPAAQAIAAQVDPNFVGREEAIAELNLLAERGARVIVMQARGGVGKTTLARKYLTQVFGTFLEFPIAKETRNIASIEALVEEKLRQLGEEPGREFLVSLDRLKRKLQGERIGILIDNLEPALDSAGKFVEAHRGYVELLRVLADPVVQSLTLITTRERLREQAVSVQHYALKTLDVSAWGQFFQGRDLPTDTPALTALHHAYGGNAKAMDIVGGAIWEDFSGDVAAYWQANQDDLLVERDLEDLVTCQFERLQQLEPDAYRLLCRMGCYRYQDVPTVPIEGLFCLLWDVPEGRHRRQVVKSLQDRSLIDYENGEFWLHPVIRAEAIGRLRENPDWEATNYRTAEFWTKHTSTIQTLKDALRALEAYHHYEYLSNFDLINDSIKKEIENKWQNNLPYGLTTDEHLGTPFYSLNEPDYIVSLINRILLHIKFKYSRSKIYHILGDFYRLSGIFGKAIESYNISKEEAIGCLSSPSSTYVTTSLTVFQLKWLELIAFVDIGLCKLDLWELKEAINFFEIARSKIEDFNYDGLLDYVDTCAISVYPVLAYANSALGYSEKAIHFADNFYNAVRSGRLVVSDIAGSLVFLGSTYKNLAEIDKSSEIYEKAIVTSEHSFKPLIKARALCGMASLYRDNKSFNYAFTYHSEALKLVLENKGTKCCLAEMYYQAGLTYKAVNDFESSLVNFQEAIRLFGEMGAPRQVKRVRQSMLNEVE